MHRQVRDGREIVLQLLVAKNTAEIFPDCPNYERECRRESEPMTKGAQLIRHLRRHGWTQEPGQERVVVNNNAALNVTNGFVSQSQNYIQKVESSIRLVVGSRTPHVKSYG